MEIDCNKPSYVSVEVRECLSVAGSMLTFYWPVIPFGRNSRTLQAHKFTQINSERCYSAVNGSHVPAASQKKGEKGKLPENTGVIAHVRCSALDSARFHQAPLGSIGLHQVLLGSTKFQ